jgi:hypothetical protein
MHAHRDPALVPDDPRMRAYWRYHGEGQHKVPREGVRPDHFFCCSWCDPTQHGWEFVASTVRHFPDGSYTGVSVRTYSDREVEKFLLPQSDMGNPVAAVMGRLG